MAKFRQNHGSAKGQPASRDALFRIVIFGAILAGIIYLVFDYTGGTLVHQPIKKIDYSGVDFFLPAGTSGQVVHHKGYTLSYNEQWEQAEWVTYILEGDNLRKQWTKRQGEFIVDPKVRTSTAEDFDYRGSGYDRGHLAPFADFAWDAEQAKETFYLSNVSPQVPAFNRGIWRELEELTRDWAKDAGRLYVVTGPIITLQALGVIGRDTKVSVPQSFFKVLLDLEAPDRKAIGFVIPNKPSAAPLEHFAMSVDEVEAITDLDFYSELMPPAEETQIEAALNKDSWPTSAGKFDKRVNEWNNGY